jgi:hypothetical protein
LATVRTAVLSALVVSLAWASRRQTAVANAGLCSSTPLLALGGVKLLSQDFAQGQAATLLPEPRRLPAGALIGRRHRLLRYEEA